MALSRPLARLAKNRRAAEIAPYVGKVCKVTYRRAGPLPYDEVIQGRVIGASFHRTNGTSTGDVVVVPEKPGNVWRIDEAQYHASSIALVNVGNIEVIA